MLNKVDLQTLGNIAETSGQPLDIVAIGDGASKLTAGYLSANNGSCLLLREKDINPLRAVQIFEGST